MVSSKHAADVFRLGAGVFHRIVQKPGGDAGGVQVQVRQNSGDFEGMREVGLAREPNLSTMYLGAVHVGLPDEVDFLLREISLKFCDDVFETDHPPIHLRGVRTCSHPNRAGPVLPCRIHS